MRPRGTGELASTELDPQGGEEEEGETRASLMNLERLRQFRVMRKRAQSGAHRVHRGFGVFMDVGPVGVGPGAWGKQQTVGDVVTTGEKTRRK